MNVCTRTLSLILLIYSLASTSVVLAETDKRPAQALHNNAVLRLTFKHGLPTAHLSVSANNHILQVIGFVDNAQEMRNLMQVLSRYQGHARVINNVKILRTQDNSQDEYRLTQRIQSRLEEAKLPVEDIAIQVRNGHVIVGGFINKHIAARLVGIAVQTVPGIHRVDNYVLYKS